jgi:formate dehydrogenase subunit gamma
MAITQPRTESTIRILRFDVVQRTAHWVNAVLFTALIVTAIPLYFGSFFGIVMPRFTVEQIHLWTGIALPVPIIVSLLGPWGTQMRRDVRRVNYWTRAEIRWMRKLAKSPLEADKFNPGQKLNVIFVGASILIMLVTGVILRWFRFFPVSWRGGATFVHDLFAYVIVFVIVGHIYMAVTHRGSLMSMFRGWVSERWAAIHAPGWLKEERAAGETVEQRP